MNECPFPFFSIQFKLNSCKQKIAPIMSFLVVCKKSRSSNLLISKSPRESFLFVCISLSRLLSRRTLRNTRLIKFYDRCVAIELEIVNDFSRIACHVMTETKQKCRCCRYFYVIIDSARLIASFAQLTASNYRP